MIKVQKFGGSSLASINKLKEVGEFIKQNLKEGERICVVVSAMGQTTNEMVAMAHEITSAPNKREMDMLVSCGERSSMALLSIALNHIGVSAISLTGSQSGIITDSNHNQAQIIAIKPKRVLEAFEQHQVVIIAGFQGVSLHKEITTLKRGGSDTTAVAMAAALKAHVCEIYTDVLGVMDADPRMIPKAKLISDLSYEQMEGFALYGAKVLALDAIRLAKDAGINLIVAQTGSSQIGSKISGITPIRSKRKPCFTHLRAVVRFELSHEQMDELNSLGGYLLCGGSKENSFVGYMSNDIAQEFTHLKGLSSHSSLALLVVHNSNDILAEMIAQICSLLKSNFIELKDIFIGNSKIFIVVDDNHLARTLNVIRTGLFTAGEQDEE